MIDTAIPDMTQDGLVNFDKRRKEFEVLAQIKLLQGAANAYHIETDGKFNRWFDAVLLLDEKEAFDFSCKLEPSSSGSSSALNQSLNSTGSASKDQASGKKLKKRSNGFYHHRKNDSIASTASSSSESQFCFDQDLMIKGHSLLEEDVIDVGLGRDSVGGSGRWSSAQSSNEASVESCSNIISSPEPKPTAPSSEQNATTVSSTKSDGGGAESASASSSKSAIKPTPESPYKTSEFYIIRVSIEASGPETEGVIMYKSIMIGNHERTREVIRNAMMKHGLEGSPDNYTLSQVLPDKGEY